MHHTPHQDKEVTFAHTTIKEFFKDIGLSCARADTEALIKYAAANKVYRQRNPSNLLYFRERFEELAAAAFTLVHHYSERPAAGISLSVLQSGSVTAEHFVEPGGSIWFDFPRNLTAAQFANPYKGLRKFACHGDAGDWQKIMKDLVEYALSTDTIHDEYDSGELMAIRRRMLQLIEALHLIHVRTNFPVPAKEKKNSKPKKK